MHFVYHTDYGLSQMTLPHSGHTRYNHMRRFPFILISLALFFATAAFSSDNTSIGGRVVDVADGDTITVLTQNQEKIKVRLSGVDCPEGFQVHGEKSKQFTSSLVSGKRISLEPVTVDQYGRTVALVFIDGKNVNEQIVAHGHCWVYRNYCKANYCNDWLKLEATARDAQVGLWENANPMPPWDWRAEQREKDKTGGGLGNKIAATVTAPSSGTNGSSTVYHGNTRSHVFHGPGCKDYNCKNCTVVLGNVKEAVGVGYRAHQACVK